MLCVQPPPPAKLITISLRFCSCNGPGLVTWINVVTAKISPPEYFYVIADPIHYTEKVRTPSVISRRAVDYMQNYVMNSKRIPPDVLLYVPLPPAKQLPKSFDDIFLVSAPGALTRKFCNLPRAPKSSTGIYFGTSPLSWGGQGGSYQTPKIIRLLFISVNGG